MSFKDYMARNKKMILTRCLVLLFFMFIGLAGYGTAVLSEKERQQASDWDNEVPAAADEQKTQNDCTVTWEYVYGYCGHKKTAEAPITEDMTGLTLKQLESKFRNIKIIDFSPKYLTLQKKIDQYCPDHLILKVSGDTLGVFRTDTGKDTASMISRVAIPYSAIPEQYRQQLQYGDVFNSMEEIQKFIAEKLLH